jgi:hypothetical protein
MNKKSILDVFKYNDVNERIKLTIKNHIFSRCRFIKKYFKTVVMQKSICYCELLSSSHVSFYISSVRFQNYRRKEYLENLGADVLGRQMKMRGRII